MGAGWSEISESRRGRRKKSSQIRAHRNVRCHLETGINGSMSITTWQTQSEMKCIISAALHVMLCHDHHLLSTPSTTPHCAVTAKARLSSLLFCGALPREGRHEQPQSCARRYLCQGPQTILCNELQAKCCREIFSTEHRLSKRCASLPPIYECYINKISSPI